LFFNLERLINAGHPNLNDNWNIAIIKIVYDYIEWIKDCFSLNKTEA